MALGAMLLFGIADLVYKRAAAAGAQAHQFIMVQAWVFMPSVTLYAFATGALPYRVADLWGSLAGFFSYYGFYNFARSLKEGAVSVNAPIFRLSFVVTAALAIAILGEPLTASKVAGLALALAAAWLLLGGPATAQQVSRASIVRVLSAAVAVGIANFAHKEGLRAGGTPASLVSAQACVVVSLATLYSALADRGIRPVGAAVRHAPLAALALAVAFILMVAAMARAQASVAVPISQMGFVVTALLGLALLGEAFSARKAAGLGAAVAAIICLAL